MSGSADQLYAQPIYSHRRASKHGKGSDRLTGGPVNPNRPPAAREGGGAHHVGNWRPGGLLALPASLPCLYISRVAHHGRAGGERRGRLAVRRLEHGRIDVQCRSLGGEQARAAAPLGVAACGGRSGRSSKPWSETALSRASDRAAITAPDAVCPGPTVAGRQLRRLRRRPPPLPVRRRALPCSSARPIVPPAVLWATRTCRWWTPRRGRPRAARAQRR